MHVSPRAARGAGEDLFEHLVPPFDLESDMLFAFAATSTADLGRHHPDVPFLGVGGATPLVLWFSRVRRLEHGPEGGRTSLDEASGFGYDELNVVAVLRTRGLFVPGIYATSDLTLRLGHRYGMPKERAPMTFAADAHRVASEVRHGRARSRIEARLLASGRLFGAAIDRASPWWTWPVHFPDGSFVRALVRRVPRAQLAHVRGRLALEEPWLPHPVSLLPLGAFVPGHRMRLPAPEARGDPRDDPE